MVQVLLCMQVVSVAAESSVRLTVEEVYRGEGVTTSMVIGPAFVATLSNSNTLISLYDAETRNLWLLDHDRRLAQQINRTEVRIFANSLAREVAEFRASLATLPEDQRILSMERFQQLFDKSGYGDGYRGVDQFIPQNKTGEFAGVPCRWYDMLDSSRGDTRLLGAACLAESDAITNGKVLASYLTEVTTYFDIVKEADTGPVQFPVIGHWLGMPAKPGFVALKIQGNRGVANDQPELEVVSVSVESGSASDDYRIPYDYRRQEFSDSFARPENL